MRPEFERVQNLLSDTVTLLCKNGLTYDKEMKVQGLLGITLDEKDVFVVHFNELFSQAVAASIVPEEESDSESEEEAIIIPSKNHTNSPNNRAAKRSHRDSSVDLVQIKTESDDVILLDPKKEPGGHGINNDYGPSSKRRLIENPATIQSPTLPGDTPNYMSAVSRHSENSNTSWDGTQPPNIHIAGVSSLGTNSNMPSLEQQSASWDPSQLPSPQLAQNSQNPIPGSDAALPLHGSASKKGTGHIQGCYPCLFPGCTRIYVYETSARRHERERHNFYRSKEKEVATAKTEKMMALQKRLYSSGAELGWNADPTDSNWTDETDSGNNRIRSKYKEENEGEVASSHVLESINEPSWSERLQDATVNTDHDNHENFQEDYLGIAKDLKSSGEHDGDHSKSDGDEGKADAVFEADDWSMTVDTEPVEDSVVLDI